MTETVQRAYQFRFYPTASQRAKPDVCFGDARWAWNRSLEFRTKAYRRRGESVTGVDFSRLFTRLKRTRRYAWLNTNGTPRTVVDQKLRDRDRAFANFFAGRAKYPRYRKRRAAQSIRLQLDRRRIGSTFDANDHRLSIQGLGQAKLRWSHRPHCPQCTDEPGCPACPKPKMVTVRRTTAGGSPVAARGLHRATGGRYLRNGPGSTGLQPGVRRNANGPLRGASPHGGVAVCNRRGRVRDRLQVEATG